MNKFIIILSLGFLIANFNVQAQEREPILIPLSNPGQDGMLTVNVHNGAINITTHNKSEVELILHEKEGKKSDKKSRSGLRRIEKQNIDVSITEDNNEVKVISTQNSRTDIDLKVPKNFSLFVSTHHNGTVYINGIKGDMEVRSHHGGIKMEAVSGSVIADTHHGAIEVTMQEINPNAPMAFTTYHGDVDVTFPSDLTGTLKMKSSKGEIYTDFDFKASKPKIFTTTKGSRKEIKLEGWTYGQIGSSKEELTFKTYHGDVIIRQN